MKRIISVTLCVVLVFAALAISSCGIINDLNSAVTYPEVYSLSYEVTSAEGVIHTVVKTVDEKGNVYVKTAEEERLYINDNGSYTLYEKDANGSFAVSGDEKYTAKAVASATSEIAKYAEESKKKFMPTATKDGDKEIAGRACEAYKLGVGNENNGAYYYYYVDVETGICLGVEVKNVALGEEVEHNSETFICVEFVTENIENLEQLI